MSAGAILEQAALFDIPQPPKLTHDWMWRPLGPSECAACLELWFADASHAQVAAFLTETCPVKAPGAAQVAPAIIYLV